MTSPTPKSASTDDVDRVRERASREASEASHLMSDASRAVREKAGSVAAGMKGEAQRRGDELKDETTASLRGFADAVRAASDELSQKDHGAAAQLVRQAASGLETFSNSLGSKSSGDIVEMVRNFGRSNPTAFVAGSVLAGLALGRFVGSSAEHRHEGASASARSPASALPSTASGLGNPATRSSTSTPRGASGFEGKTQR